MTQAGQNQRSEQGKTAPADWESGPEAFFKAWHKSIAASAESWKKLWTELPAPASPAEWAERWAELWRKPAEATADANTDGIGPQLFNRLINAGSVYLTVVSFWEKAIPALLTNATGLPDSKKIEALNEQWLKHYKEVMKALWGAQPTAEQSEIIDSVGRMLKLQTDLFSKFGAPMLDDLKAVSEKIPAVLQGDRQKMLEILGIFRDDYDKTAGKIFNMPAMGYFSQFQQRFNQLVDSYIRYRNALNEYFTLLYQTGIKGAEKVVGRIDDFRSDDWTTKEAAHKFYRAWMTINEETFHDLFVSPQFIAMLNEVLTRGLLFRKSMDEFYDKLVENSPLPNRRDMDEVYKSLYELRKELRALKKETDRLKSEIEASATASRVAQKP
jgi:class III poly(R)-hydroxyalkanoic acid synthase PhaE subunit